MGGRTLGQACPAAGLRDCARNRVGGRASRFADPPRLYPTETPTASANPTWRYPFFREGLGGVPVPFLRLACCTWNWRTQLPVGCAGCSRTRSRRRVYGAPSAPYTSLVWSLLGVRTRGLTFQTFRGEPLERVNTDFEPLRAREPVQIFLAELEADKPRPARKAAEAGHCPSQPV